MEKRNLTPLRNVLVRYLVVCGGGSLVILLVWWWLFMSLIRNGFLLPAVTGAQVCSEARDYAATATVETFDPNAIDPLCRYAILQAGTEHVLQTNMTASQLKKAMNILAGGRQWVMAMASYQYVVDMADGARCILQYDYSTPYADPALREVLPDFQTMYILLLILLEVLWLALWTHRTVKVLAGETRKLTKATAAITAQHPEEIEVSGAKVREFAETLRAMQTMGSQLTASLQSQWQLEQQRAEQTAALAHDLKTPLAIITGNADLLAEDENLTKAQKAQIAAMQRAAEKADRYLQTLRAVNTAENSPQEPMQPVPVQEILAPCANDAKTLCENKNIQFVLNNAIENARTIPAQRQALGRALDNILENAIRFTPAGGTITLDAVEEGQEIIFTVTDTGPGFSPEALQKAGRELFTTDAARGQHWGLGLAAARRTAQTHNGTLTVSNGENGGGKVELRVRR